MASLDWFEEDQRPEAFAELDRRWDETFDVIPRSVVNVRRWIDTMTNGDVSSYRALYGDDMVSIDHRPIGLGTRSADEMAQSMAPLLGRMDVVTIEVIAFDDQLALTLPQARVRDDDSQFKMLVVWGFDPETDLIRNFEMFDESDRAAALTRFHELAGASPPAAVVDTTDELANRAVRIVHDLDVALRSGDLERAIGLLDERFASSGGHRADSGGALDRDAFIDDMQAALADANVDAGRHGRAWRRSRPDPVR